MSLSLHIMFSRAGRRLYSNFHNYFRNRPPDHMTKLLISINLGVWGGWMFLNPSFMHRHFVMSEFNTIHQGKYYTILTSSFSHHEPLHLAFNMLGLWFFGRHIEMLLGPAALLTLYLTGAVGGYCGLWWKYKRHQWPRPIPNVMGASAATTAIFTYFVFLDPWATVIVFIFPMPAILAGLLFLSLSGGQSSAGSGHIGGAVAGALCYLLRRRIF